MHTLSRAKLGTETELVSFTADPAEEEIHVFGPFES
jgi:hypothetical protein